MGVPVITHPLTTAEIHESIEENLIEVAFAEAADFDDSGASPAGAGGSH